MYTARTNTRSPDLDAGAESELRAMMDIVCALALGQMSSSSMVSIINQVSDEIQIDSPLSRGALRRFVYRSAVPRPCLAAAVIDITAHSNRLDVEGVHFQCRFHWSVPRQVST